MHHVKIHLEKERKILADQISSLAFSRENKKSTNIKRQSDQSIKMQDEEILIKLSNLYLLKLKKIDAALERIKRNKYGICTMCGGSISKKRLIAMNMTTECIDCAI